MLKKIIAFLSATAMICSLAATVSAAPAEVSINPSFEVVKLEEPVDGEYGYEFIVNYEGEAMTSKKQSGKYSGTAFTMIQLEVNHPEAGEELWADSEYGSWSLITPTHGQYLFQGGNGTYYAVESGMPMFTLYTPNDLAAEDFEIDFVLATVDTFSKNVTSIQTNYSTRQEDIEKGSAHYIATIVAAEGEEPDEPVVPSVPEFAATDEAQETVYLDQAATKPVYVFDCSVVNYADNDVTIKFAADNGATMTRTLTDLPVIEGEDGNQPLWFTALVLNAPGVVTVDSIAD